MKIAVCPDSFKGSMSAREAAEAMREGVLDALSGADVVMLPVGDGGEGTVEALTASMEDVTRVECETVDALRRPVKAYYAVSGGHTAYMESAAASGLTLIQPGERDIMDADTGGTGVLIADAYSRGIRRFVIGMGGTATCDGGIGAFRTLETLVPELRKDSASGAVEITLLCDVENPLCGPLGAATVFGPQKGATSEMVPALDRRLKAAAKHYAGLTGIDIAGMKYAGAAGGLAGMLMACYGARPVPGISKVLEILDFDSRLEGVALVITGEGKADATTLSGKAPMGILSFCRKKSIPVALVCGQLTNRKLLLDAGFCRAIQATPANRDAAKSYPAYLRDATGATVRCIVKE